MTLTNENEMNPHGEALVEELRRVHDMIRGNLDVIQALIEEITAGASAHTLPGQQPRRYQYDLDAACGLSALLQLCAYPSSC